MPYIFPIKPKPFAAWTVIFAGLFLPIPLLSVGGCGREMQGVQNGGGSGHGALSLPPPGFVRIVSRQIENAAATKAAQTGPSSTKTVPESLHYKWSLIGERNWQNPKADKNGFTLGDVYPLNSTTNRGGCNIWECDLIARSTAATVEWQLIIHGSNGQTAQTEGRVSQPSGGNVEDSVHVVQTRDEPTSLPTDLVLARVGSDEVRLRVAQ